MSIVFLVIVLLILFYLLFILPTQWLKVEQVHHSLGINIKILQISDIHIENMRVSLQKIRQVILTENPDYIFLTGDFIDHQFDEIKLNRFLREIVLQSQAPIYAVLGNHDYDFNAASKIEQLLTSYKITLLKNEQVDVGRFQIIAIDDYCTGHSSMDFYKESKSYSPKIVITHDPTVTYEIPFTFDYLMAGHFHGKQFNIPFFFSLRDFGPMSKNGIYKGLHHFDKGMIYISKGLGQSVYNYRFFVRSEISIHHF